MLLIAGLIGSFHIGQGCGEPKSTLHAIVLLDTVPANSLEPF